MEHAAWGVCVTGRARRRGQGRGRRGRDFAHSPASVLPPPPLPCTPLLLPAVPCRPLRPCPTREGFAPRRLCPHASFHCARVAHRRRRDAPHRRQNQRQSRPRTHSHTRAPPHARTHARAHAHCGAPAHRRSATRGRTHTRARDPLSFFSVAPSMFASRARAAPAFVRCSSAQRTPAHTPAPTASARGAPASVHSHIAAPCTPGCAVGAAAPTQSVDIKAVKYLPLAEKQVR